MSARDYLNKSPMLGWGVAAVLAIAAGVMFAKTIRGGETHELSQEVTIRCRETGKEWKMPRGAMEKQLYQREYPVDANEGLINPETGKATGFPVDDWKAAVARINADRKPQAEAGTGGGGTPAAPAKK